MGLTTVEKRALSGGVFLPDLSELPIRVPREVAANLLTKYFFKTSARSLERWPLRWRNLNGRAHCETAELFAEAERRLNEAAVVMGGKRAT
jgi:hypothetical protein